MKIAVALTAEGIIRALRGRAHDLAEATELRYRRGAQAPRKRRQVKPQRRTKGRDRDDVADG